MFPLLCFGQELSFKINSEYIFLSKSIYQELALEGQSDNLKWHLAQMEQYKSQIFDLNTFFYVKNNEGELDWNNHITIIDVSTQSIELSNDYAISVLKSITNKLSIIEGNNLLQRDSGIDNIDGYKYMFWKFVAKVKWEESPKYFMGCIIKYKTETFNININSDDNITLENLITLQ